MTVYVDCVEHQFGRMSMSHMWADTIVELMIMAKRIGVDHKWLQEPPGASWLHFDVCKAKKEMAIRFGAVVTDKYGPLEHVSKLKGDDATLRRIAKVRLMIEDQGSYDVLYG